MKPVNFPLSNMQLELLRDAELITVRFATKRFFLIQGGKRKHSRALLRLSNAVFKKNIKVENGQLLILHP